MRGRGLGVCVALLAWVVPVWAKAQEEQPAQEQAAQADIDKARGLIKLGRAKEAVPLLESAYLELEDPEILRLLAEAHLAAGDVEASRRVQAQYLTDERVGERAREAARARFAELEGAAGVKEEDEDEDLDLGLTGWRSGGAQIGRRGQWALGFGARLTLNESFGFTPSHPPVSGSDDRGALGEQTLNHSGGGGAVEVSWFALDGLALGGALGLDVMLWQLQRPVDEYAVASRTGWRPSLVLHARYFVGAGFYVGAGAGADVALVTEAPQAQACQRATACPEAAEGLFGARLLVGPQVGYHAELSPSLALGLDAGWLVVPGYLTASPQAQAQPGLTDTGWMLNLSVALHWML